jgi:two-component system, NtrC family, sensor histidine kinase HydH
LPSGHPLSGLSFRWQIILLGILVVVLSIAVIFAITATLRYTKSAILRDERNRLAGTARSLAQEYEDRAEIARRNKQAPPLSNANSPSSQDVLALLSRVVLQNVEGTGGGYYSPSQMVLVGSFFPEGQGSTRGERNGNGPQDMRDSILEVAQSAAATHEPAEKILGTEPGIVLIEAVPIHDGYSVVGSAWSSKRLPDLPGANRFRAYLTATGLGGLTLASVLLTLLVIRNLQAGVRKIESGLKNLEGNLASEIQTLNEPREIQEIVQAINRLGRTLQEKIEHEKQIENRLRHTERLASLGRLVAGVAHEVRNPLATIRLRVQMCGRESDSLRVKESCAIALQEMERLNGMVNRLLSFARPMQLNLEPTDLGKLVEERIESFRDLASRCRVTIIADGSSSLLVDKGRMAQVFDNIIQNAIEAMSDSGGTLAVSVASHKKDHDGGVCVEFRDTGKGMSPSIASHIFDPFFTTKASGTGLGLSICHELVRAHGGAIQVTSEAGHGTTVSVTIPVGQPVSQPESQPTAE